MKKLLFIGLLIAFLPLIGISQSLQLADSLFEKGKKYDKNGQKKQSEFYYREAYDIYRTLQDTSSWLEAGKEYASAMVYRGKTNEAMKLYKYLLSVDHPSNSTYNRGDLYNSMGWTLERIGELKQADKYYQKSLPLALKSKDSLLIGVVYNNLGYLHKNKDNFPKALKFLEKSLAFYKKKRYVFFTLSNMGDIYQKLTLYDKALEYYKRSLNIGQELGSVQLLAIVYKQLASLQRELGNFDQALVANQKALKLSRKSGTPRNTAVALNNLGLLYKQLGEYEKGLDYYRQSLSLKKEYASPISVATTTNNIGQLLWELERYKEASQYFNKAYRIRKQEGSPNDMYTSLVTMMKLYLQQKNYSKVRSYASQLKTIGDSTNGYEMLESAESFLGDVKRKQGNHREALTHYRKAYAYSKFLPSTRQLGSIKTLARQYHNVNSDSAVTYGNKAISLIEKHRSKAGATSELKSKYFGQHSDFYTEMASWVLTYRQNVDRAYKLVEQAKARSLSDQLARAAQDIDRQLPEEVRIKRRQKRNQIERLYTQLEHSDNNKQQSELETKIRENELNYTAYENKLHRQHPELKSFRSPNPVSLQQAQALTDDQTAVLEYALASDQLIIFFITPDNVRAEQMSLSEELPLTEQLTNRVADFKGIILSNASRRKLRAQSQELYDVLIKPFEKELQQISNLLIVPDGALAYLPFEALSRGDQYLIERYNIKYEPSMTSLKLLRQSTSEKRKDLLAVAGSSFSQQNTSRSPIHKQNLTALPSTLMEVDSIATKFKQAAVLKEDEVSEKRFKEMIRQNKYRYIHMATHGIIDEDRPSRSGLALSAEGKITASSKEDGMLRSSEIFGLDIESDMVVLSACNTGLGKVVKGEGILGMQRSFFYAGASTVVVSLWNVYDRSTAAFMNEFYKALNNTPADEGWTDNMLRWVGWDESIPFGSKATAMRKAKLQMIKHPLFNHPVYWAPFVVVGR